MPVGNSEWDNGVTKNSIENKILAFLVKNREFLENAFSFWEIVSGLGYDVSRVRQPLSPDYPSEKTFQDALTALTKKGRIEAKKIGSEMYYRAVKPREPNSLV